MATRTEAITAFLKAHTHPDLAELYRYSMECQVNVAQDGGTPILGEFRGRAWRGWTDSVTTWKSYRIPHNAATNPEYEDVKMTFSLEEHAEGIGMTGWDWVKRLSKWVAFDFDAILGHSDKHSKRLSVDELEAIQQALSGIPWVTIRKSAGGKGLHVYVFLEPVITQNHNEHAALARAILGQLSALTGARFESQVDICGGNMWIWHRKMKHSGGLTLIKKGGVLSEIPPNWKDHVKVVTGHRRKTLPKFIGDIDSGTTNELESFFLELTSQATRYPLDEEHRRLIQWLDKKGTQSWWDADHHMLVTHTFHLKEAHAELTLRGIFDTLATGTEAGHDHNCFAFPLRRGAWAIRRYSMGVAESPTWDQDGRGWTRCYYNMEPTLPALSRSLGGLESSAGGFVFGEAEQACDTIRKLGATVPEIPVGLRALPATVKQKSDGRVVILIDGDKNQVAKNDMKGWLHEKGKWTRIFSVPIQTNTETENLGSYDDVVRHLVTATGEDYGWAIRGEGSQWRTEPLVHVTKALEAMNVQLKDIKSILGSAVLKCWTLVNHPFQPEYPGNRVWNRNAAQFRYIPSQVETPHFPTWSKILKHVGAGLDDALKDHPWAKICGVSSGADYLKIWLASLLKFPKEPLPYLFLYGPQNSGKSILHEAISLLMTKGYKRADNALINQQGFNQELEAAICCVIEEINLRRDKNAANRIKDWVTARELPIHPKGRTPYHVPNTTHWIQCSNERDSCPVFPGDTRITMIYVGELDPTEMIPKRDIIPMLEKEAPDFMAELLALEIPPSNDRLNVPVIATADKVDSENLARTPLEVFLQESCFEVNGEMVLLGQLYEEFIKRIDPAEVGYWSKFRFGRELPTKFPKGRSPKDGQVYVGNISLQRLTATKPRLKSTPPDEHRNVFLVPESPNGKHDQTNSGQPQA